MCYATLDSHFSHHCDNRRSFWLFRHRCGSSFYCKSPVLYFHRAFSPFFYTGQKKQCLIKNQVSYARICLIDPNGKGAMQVHLTGRQKVITGRFKFRPSLLRLSKRLHDLLYYWLLLLVPDKTRPHPCLICH